MPTEVSGNKFYDFPSLDGDAHRHALGAHLTNKFQMSVKNMIVYNNEVKILMFAKLSEFHKSSYPI